MEAQVHYAACFYRCFFGHCPPNRTIDPTLTFVREPCRRTMALLAIFRVGWTEHHNKPPCTLDLDALDSVSTRKCCRVNMNTVAATWISVCIVDYYVAIAKYYSLTAPAVWLQAPKLPLVIWASWGRNVSIVGQVLVISTGFQKWRYRVTKWPL